MNNTTNLFYIDLGTWNDYVSINCFRHMPDHFDEHLVFFASLIVEIESEV